MRRLHLRVTVKRLMIVVAISASTIAAIRMWQRWSYCRYQAERWAGIAEAFQFQADAVRSNGVGPRREIERDVALMIRQKEHAERQRQQFSRVASRPWLKIPSDLPLP